MLLVMAAVGFLLSGFAATTGGFRVHVLGVPLSVRGPIRAAAFSTGLAVAGFYLHAPLRQAFHPSRLRLTLPRAGLILLRLTVTSLPYLATLTVLGAGLLYGTKVAGGSDGYGYVSQIELWRQGQLRIEQPIAAAAPWPGAHWTFAPLGYRPAPGYTIVPTYPPGIPLLMLAFVSVFGAGAEFWLMPLSGAAVVLLTYLIGRRVGGRPVGISASLCIASSPILLLTTCWLLGDLPAAAFWMLSLWLSLHRTRPGAAGSGAAAAMAIVIRPNLVPLMVVPLIVGAWRHRQESATGPVWRAATFAAALAPGPIFIAWLFNDLYGSPFLSGYGDAAGLFSLRQVGPNLRLYSAWLVQSHGPFLFLFPAAALLALRKDASRTPIALVAFVALVWGCYAVYLAFDAWWYVRFLLPALPLMFVLSSHVVWIGLGRTRRGLRLLVLIVATALTIAYGLHQAFGNLVFATGRHEQRYVIIGSYVRDHLPPNAVVYSLQHSGSIRYYSGKLTLRYVFIPEDWLDRSVAFMREAGYDPYLLVEAWEIEPFKQRFAGQRAAARLERPSSSTMVAEALLFRLEID